MGVWIDTDMGFDDIAAILVAVSEGLVIDGISLVFGNTELDQVCRNAAGATQTFGWTFPIYRGLDRPLVGALETAASILGDSGIPTLSRMLPDCDLPIYPDTLDALIDWLGDGEGEKRLMALGPLTNIAKLCQDHPDLASKISEITWMGGGITTGNHTASAEFNAFADPEAVDVVIASGIPFKMIDLDVCRKVTADMEDVAALRQAGGENAELMADMLGGFVSIATRRGRSAMALYDPVAGVAFARPELLTFQHARIDVELAGTFTRGRTCVEPRDGKAGPFNAWIAPEIDAAKAKDVILSALRGV
jgi:purine nucleosidase